MRFVRTTSDTTSHAEHRAGHHPTVGRCELLVLLKIGFSAIFGAPITFLSVRPSIDRHRRRAEFGRSSASHSNRVRSMRRV